MPQVAESITPSTLVTPKSPTLYPQMDPESTFDFVPFIGCNTPHFVGMVHHTNDDYGDSESSNSSGSPNPRQFPAQVFMINQGAEEGGNGKESPQQSEEQPSEDDPDYNPNAPAREEEQRVEPPHENMGQPPRRAAHRRRRRP